MGKALDAFSLLCKLNLTFNPCSWAKCACQLNLMSLFGQTTNCVIVTLFCRQRVNYCSWFYFHRVHCTTRRLIVVYPTLFTSRNVICSLSVSLGHGNTHKHTVLTWFNANTKSTHQHELFLGSGCSIWETEATQVTPLRPVEGLLPSLRWSVDWFSFFCLIFMSNYVTHWIQWPFVTTNNAFTVNCNLVTVGLMSQQIANTHTVVALFLCAYECPPLHCHRQASWMNLKEKKKCAGVQLIHSLVTLRSHD